MKLLALDPATHCGFAVGGGPRDGLFTSGVWNLSVRKDESSGMRLIRLRGKLNEISQAIPIDLCVFESSRNLRFGNAVRVAGEILGVIKVWCIDNDIDFRGFSPAEIKKHATGKGNAKKDAMIKAAQEKWGAHITDENEADALWLLDLAIHELCPSEVRA